MNCRKTTVPDLTFMYNVGAGHPAWVRVPALVMQDAFDLSNDADTALYAALLVRHRAEFYQCAADALAKADGKSSFLYPVVIDRLPSIKQRKTN